MNKCFNRTIFKIGIALIIFIFIVLESCIYTDVEYDYYGKWISTDYTFGNLAEEVILDIHESEAKVSVNGGDFISGPYYISNNNIIFEWDVTMNGTNILLLDANISKGVLLVRWKHPKVYYPFTSIFKKY